MSAHIQATVFCDEPGCEYHGEPLFGVIDQPIADLRRELQAQGWRSWHGRDICPNQHDGDSEAEHG